MIRRIGERIVCGQRYRMRPGVYAVLVRGNEVLLTFQAAPQPEFQLPGGGIDAGEHPLPALHREVMEETGWTIGGARRIGAFRRFTYMPEYDRWAEKVCAVYVARPVLRIGPPTQPGHRAFWVRAGAAAGLLGNDGDRMFLRRVLAATG